MKKAILKTIKPKCLVKILNGEQTIILSKNMPKCELPIDVYIYCSKGEPYLFEYMCLSDDYSGYGYDISYAKDEHDPLNSTILNGKVVAKFTLNKVEKFKVEHLPLLQEMGYVSPYTLISFTGNLKTMYLEQNSCLLLEDVYKYAQNENVFAWHIENLEIFDTPMELIQFEKYCDEPDDLKPCCNDRCCEFEDYDWCEQQCYCSLDYEGINCPYLKVKKPPRSWQYVYVNKDIQNGKGNKYEHYE